MKIKSINAKSTPKNIDYCLYTDTDSVFYEALPLIKHRYPDYNIEDVPDLTIEIATEVQNYINGRYDEYAFRYHNLKSHRWNIKQELVAKRAFWGSSKKRYAMWIVRDGSKVVDDADIKGFDSVRSSFAKLFREFMEGIIIDILHDMSAMALNKKVIEFKHNLIDYDMMDIMSPTSVKDMEKWAVHTGYPFKKSTPIHVKAAMNYNILLDVYGIEDYPKIVSGDKILWAYISKNAHDMKTVAIRGFDDPPQIMEFLGKFIYREMVFDRALTKKLQSIWSDLGWGTVLMNKNLLKVFSFE